MPKDLATLRLAHERAAPLHEEIPYWGWLEDGRTLLTVGGELVTLAALETYEASGRPGEYLDFVLERWVRLLSAAGSRTRVYLYLLRRPARSFASGVSAEGGRAELARRAPRGAPPLPGAPAADARRLRGMGPGRAAEAAAGQRYAAAEGAGDAGPRGLGVLLGAGRDRARGTRVRGRGRRGGGAGGGPDTAGDPGPGAGRARAERTGERPGPFARACRFGGEGRLCRGRWRCRRSRRSASHLRVDGSGRVPALAAVPALERRWRTSWRTSSSSRRAPWS